MLCLQSVFQMRRIPDRKCYASKVCHKIPLYVPGRRAFRTTAISSSPFHVDQRGLGRLFSLAWRNGIAYSAKQRWR